MGKLSFCYFGQWIKWAWVCFFLFNAYKNSAQSIVCPDTVCAGTTVAFHLSGNTQFATYAWEFETNSLSYIFSSSTPVPGTGTNGNAFSVTDQATMVLDTVTNNYYAFVTCAGNNFGNPNVQRLFFGTDPNSAPVITNLGNPNNVFTAPSYSNLEAAEIVIDDRGIYHAFFNNRGVVHWVFGNGLGNLPTLTTRIFNNPSVLGMGMQMAVLKADGQWFVFAGQSYGINNIVRFDLGSDLNNIPATLPYVVLPAPTGGFSAPPSYFAILKEAGNWYMKVSALGGNTPLYRYAFGANIQNNTPAVTNLGTTNFPMNTNRGLNFFKSCDSFFMFGVNEDGNVLSFNYQNNINSTPSNNTLGLKYGLNVRMVVMKPYWFKDTLWALSTNWNDNPNTTVYRFPLAAITSGNTVVKYYDPAASYTFSRPGVYNIRLYCDQADPRGPQAFCRQVVVLDKIHHYLGADTLLCKAETYTITAAHVGGTKYRWSNGDTTAAIRVSTTGSYWVEVVGSDCVNGTDTVNVTFSPGPKISITPDTPGVCAGQSVQLLANGGEEYSWLPVDYLDNPNTSSPTAKPPHTLTYHLTVSDEFGCTASDSVTVLVHPLPAINITQEDSIISCENNSVRLYASGANLYNWSPGVYCDDSLSASPLVSPPAPTAFYVTGTNQFGCTGVDSVFVSVWKIPVFFVPTAFSPNGDGNNDKFVPIVYCDWEVTLFRVYNRYGQMMHESKNMANGWDGQVGTLYADVGTYFWYIECIDRNGKKITKRGDVHLIR